VPSIIFGRRITLEKRVDMHLFPLRSQIGTVRHHRQLCFDFAGLWTSANGAGGVSLWASSSKPMGMNMSYLELNLINFDAIVLMPYSLMHLIE
jgi:hypothetical protein